MENSRMDLNPSRIARQPAASDPRELAIRERLNSLLSTEWASKAIDDLRQRQEEFLKLVMGNTSTSEKLRDTYGKLLAELADSVRAGIASGWEFVEKVRGQKGVIIITNHLGMAKLTRIDNKNRNFPVELDEIEPFLARHVAIVRVAELLNAPLFETAIELPSPLLEVQKACGVITVAPEGEGRTEKLIKDVQRTVQQNPGAVIVMYPEGGTSGKRNEGGPYDLDTFHKGAFAVAAQTGLPILPVCQFFNPESGFELHILEPLRLGESDLDNLDQIKESTKAAMQEKLVEVSSRE